MISRPSSSCRSRRRTRRRAERIDPSVSLTAASSLCTREPMRCGTNARCTTGGAGGNRGFSAMMLVERHRNGIAKVCDVRKHGIRLAALSTFFSRARLGCAAQATLHPPLYITNPQKRSPKRRLNSDKVLFSFARGRERCDRKGHAVFLRPRVDSAIMGSASTGISTSSTKLKKISTFCRRLPLDLSGA